MAAKKALTLVQKKRAAALVAKRQEKFCIEYVFNGNNGTQAWLTTQPKCKTTSAATEAWRLLRNAEIQQRISELREEHHQLLMTGRKEIIQEAAGLAMFDPANMFGEDGRLLPLHEMDAVTRKMVNKIEMIIDDGDLPVRLAKIEYGKDKKGYIDMMMKHYNQYEAHQESGKTEITVQHLYIEDAHL